MRTEPEPAGTGQPANLSAGWTADRLADRGSDGHRALLDDLLADLGPDAAEQRLLGAL